MTRETEILRVLKPYIAAFPNTKIQGEAWPIYASVLSSLTPEELNAAMRKLLHTAKFFPTIAEIFEAARSVREYAEGSSIPTAAEAWKEVMDLVDKYHMYKPWEYSCPEVRQAAECFGKEELCMLLQSEVSIARAQFMRMYNEIVGRRREDRENKKVLEALPASKKVLAKVIQISEARRA